MTAEGTHKTGTVFSASSHSICALIGAGVLALPQAVAWMGWVGGLTCLLFFYIVQLGASYLLAGLYEVNGKKYGRYQDVVAAFLGSRGKAALLVCQTANIVCFTIAYTITASISMKEMSQHICADGSSSCLNKTWQLAAIFGGIQLIFSQLPNLESAWWMSALGAAMSIGYAGIALGLCIANAHNGHGTVGGIETSTPDKIFGIFNALGSIAFAFSFSVILLEIQDTLREPPKAFKSMKKVIHISLGVSLSFYFAISVTGYLAFGNLVHGDVLAGFDGPSWLVTVANGLVVVHMISAYQVYAQPLFVLAEWEVWYKLMHHKRPKQSRRSSEGAAGAASSKVLSALEAGQRKQRSTAGQQRGATTEAGSDGDAMAATEAAHAGMRASPFENQEAPLPSKADMAQLEQEESEEEQPPALSPNLSTHYSITDMHVHLSPAPLWLRLAWRSCFVCATTLVAILMPFFSYFVGLVGGLMFWPLSIGFPLGCWLVVRKPTGWRKNGALALAAFMLLVGLAAVIGSVRNIIQSWSDFTIFS